MRVPHRLNAAAFAGWLACMVPALVDINAGRLSGSAAVVWTLAFVAFGAAYATYLRSIVTEGSRAALFLTTVQTVTGLAMVATAPGMTKYLCGITLVIVAGEVPHVVSSRITRVWVALQILALSTLFAASFSWLGALSAGSAFAAFHVFAAHQAYVEKREQAAKGELMRANAELRATRELLAWQTRAAERLRIARDLHDSLGNHLTALSIQLDVAAQSIDGPSANRVREAHAITKLLLSDVRSVVDELRDTGGVDLAGAIRRLTAQWGGVVVHLDMPETLRVDEDGQANALMRAVQEILTNTTRHAVARNVWIRLAPTETGIELEARDDGIGSESVKFGNGLTGMRERFEEQQGTITVTTSPGNGFNVRALLPRREPAS